MKNLILLSFAITAMLASSAFALPSANGSWSVTSRICSDGSPADDRFELGKDTLVLTIYGHIVIISVKFLNGRLVNIGEIDQVAKTISVFDSEGTLDISSYELSDQNELTLISTHFGEGGSCLSGETLYSVFERL